MVNTKLLGSNQLDCDNPRSTLPQNPVPPVLPSNVQIITGVCIKDCAKITGITPAVFTFIGITVLVPPTIFLPCIFFEYWTGILRSAPCKKTTRTTTAIITAAIITAAKVPFAGVFPLINCSKSDVKSLGIREIMLMTRTIEIPFPTPFSVILSPIHISTEDPAVKAATTISTFSASNFSNWPLRPNPIAIAIDSVKANPTVT